MSSIEDILNANDSADEDDDVAIDGVDLNMLLEDSDDDESTGRSSSLSRTSLASRRSLSSKRESNRVTPAKATTAVTSEATTFATTAVLATSSVIAPRPPVPSSSSSSFSPARLKPTVHTASPYSVNAVPRTVRSRSNSGSTANANFESVIDSDMLSSGSMPDSLERVVRREKSEMRMHLSDVPSALEDKLRAVQSQMSTTKLSSIKLQRVEKVSSQLKKNSHFQRHGPGVAKCVHRCDKSTTIGTSKGLILVFSAVTDELQQVLGSSISERSSSAVRAITTIPETDLLVCGYSTGELALWDTAKGVILKRVNDVHSAAIIRLKYIPSSLEVKTRSGGKSQVISIDDKGVTYSFKISRNKLWSSYSFEPDCILDGGAGPILDFVGTEVLGNEANPLLAINSSHSTYVVSVEPSIKIVDRWPIQKSEVSAEPPGLLVSLDWKLSTGNDGSQSYHLLRSSNRKIETMVYPIAVKDGGPIKSDFRSSIVFALPTDNTEVSDFIFSARWLRDTEGVLVVTNKRIFVVGSDQTPYESITLEEHAIDITSILVGEHGMSHGVVPSILHGYSGVLYFLCTESLFRVYLQPWPEKVDIMITQGKWLDALASAIQCAQSSNANDRLVVANYIKRYVGLSISKDQGGSGQQYQRDKNHYSLVSKVCIEYCILTDHYYLLFGEIYNEFCKANQQIHFFEALEAQLYARKIKSLPMTIITAMLPLFGRMQKSSTLDRCIASIQGFEGTDIYYVACFACEHRLYNGLLSFLGRTTLAGAFQVAFECLLRTEDHAVQTTIRTKLLLYLVYSFDGKEFPSSRTVNHSDRELMQLTRILLRDVYESRALPGLDGVVSRVLDQVKTVLPDVCDAGIDYQTATYPYMAALVEGDSSSFFYMISRLVQCLKLRRAAIRRSGELTLLLVSVFEELLKFTKSRDAGNGRLQRNLLEWTYNDIVTCPFTLSQAVAETTIRFSSSQKASVQAERYITDLGNRFDESAHSWILGALKDAGFWKAAVAFCKLHKIKFEVGWSEVDFRSGMESYLGMKTSESRRVTFEFIRDFFRCYPSRASIDTTCVLKLLPHLYDVSSDLLQGIAGEFLVNDVKSIVERTRHQPSLQFACLDAIVQKVLQTEGAQKLEICFIPDHLTLYVKLLAMCEPQRVYGIVSITSGYNLEECLSICESKGIFDSTCFLLKKVSGADVALTHALLELTKILEDWKESDISSSDAHVPKLKHVAAICSDSQDNVLWMKALEFFLAQSRKAEGDSDDSSLINLTQILLREFVGIMRLHLRAHDILSNIKGRFLGEFRDIIHKMTYADMHDIAATELCFRLHQKELGGMKREMIKAMRRGRLINDEADISPKGVHLVDAFHTMLDNSLLPSAGSEDAGFHVGARYPGALPHEPLYSNMYM